jgi:hypothetical protein
MVVNQRGSFEIEGWRGMAEDEYADALLAYWAAVKEAEKTIAPFFDDGLPHTPEQLELIASVVAQVGAAEEVYFAALKAAGHTVPRSITRAEIQ